MRRKPSAAKERIDGAKRKRAVTSMVIRKLRKLKRIVPGCRSSGADLLLRRTAAYISSLEEQVLLLESLCNHFGV